MSILLDGYYMAIWLWHDLAVYSYMGLWVYGPCMVWLHLYHMAIWLFDSIAVARSSCLWLYDYTAVMAVKAIWLRHGLAVYDYWAIWPCGYMATWLYGYVAMVYGDMPTWLFCYGLVWLYMAMRLYGFGMGESGCM